MRRSPVALRATIVASSATQQAGSSAAGSAKASEPPMVPRLRMAGWAISGTASASSGHVAADEIAGAELGVGGQRADPDAVADGRDAGELGHARDVDQRAGLGEAEGEGGEERSGHRPAAWPRGRPRSRARRRRQASPPGHRRTAALSSLAPPWPDATSAVFGQSMGRCRRLQERAAIRGQCGGTPDATAGRGKEKGESVTLEGDRSRHARSLEGGGATRGLLRGRKRPM